METGVQPSQRNTENVTQKQIGMLSVIIPVLNEEEIIESNSKKLSDFLDSLGIKYEIIICDNGSTDATREKGEKIHNVRFFSIAEKGAVGWAFRESVGISKFDNIVSLDMDLSSDLGFIPRALELLEKNSMVIGTKKEMQRRPLHRMLISSVYIAMARILLGLGFSDYSMSSKAYRKQDIGKHIGSLVRDSSYVIQLAYLLKREGRQVAQIPVSCEDNRKSRFSIKREAYGRFIDLMRLRLS
ncbi:MAG: glycosyltransferase family 2 protein [Candidatus Aenigmarchaeota archaeon]|nr:glycosyltransferase family 2 protein [Candidatus Aenigmarchaeota archaeon]